ncbi:MAG: family 16 glycoside hydrolase, partial [Blastocatellia bacterium]
LHIYVFLIDGANPTRYWAYGPADIEAGKWTQKIEDERWRPGRDHRYGVFIVGEEGQTLIHHYRVAARAILAVAPGADLPGIDRLTSDIVQCGSAFNIYRKETVTNKPDNDRDLAVSRTAKGETLFIDLRPFRGGNLEPLMLDYQNLTTVDDFLDKIFYSLSPRPRPHTYGVEWVLFNEANGHQYLELGSHWTKTRAMEADSRTLDEVGIRAGMRLSVRPPKVEAPPQASESQEILLSELKAQDRTGWYPDNPASWTFSDEGIGVTHSAIGGIFKRGNDWSNYEFSFEFRIIRDNGSWIVRASSLEHYVMIQCTADRIRPHIRRLQESGAVETTPIKPEGLPLKTELRLGQWATVRTDVNGSSIRVFVEGDEIWRDETFLSDFPTGSVGFRCSGHENAQFRKIRVRRLRT